MLKQVERHFTLINGDSPNEERTEVYNGLKWSLEWVSLIDLGVWREAQGLPADWCTGNVAETAERLRDSGEPGALYMKKVRFQLEMCPDPVLDTIIVVDGCLERGRKDCGETRWSIDDGCMRALSYALRGFWFIKAYLGSAREVKT